MDWCHGFRRPWSVCSSRCYAGKAPFSVLSPLTGSRQAAWSTGIGLFLLGTQKANCKRAITGTAAALPPLPFCSIWDLTAVVSTCVFCTVAGTRVYATLLLHAPSCNTTEPGLANPWLHAKIQQTKMLVTCQRFGDLFSFGLVWQYSSVHKKCDEGRFKVMAVVT